MDILFMFHTNINLSMLEQHLNYPNWANIDYIVMLEKVCKKFIDPNLKFEVKITSNGYDIKNNTNATINILTDKKLDENTFQNVCQQTFKNLRELDKKSCQNLPYSDELDNWIEKLSFSPSLV